MGCHTWFYIKIQDEKQPTHDEVKDTCIKKFKENWGVYADLIFHKYDLDKCLESTRTMVKEYDYHYDWLFYGTNIDRNRKQMEEGFLEVMKSYHKLKRDDIIDDYMIDFFNFIWTPAGWPKDKFAHTTYHNGAFYQECDENYETIHHDLFRVSNYPETVLHSYDEYMQFVTNPENGAYLYPGEKWEDVHKEMEEFWNKYPDGIVNFG